MIWENIISNDFPEAVRKAKGVCVVPIGCIEKHGPHSPLGTDTIIATEVVKRAAEKEPVVVFPTMFFGEKSGAGEFPGTVIFSVETRWHIFRETCNEIYRNGFKKILFVNGHGGNKDMLGLFIRSMIQENPNILIFSTGTNGGWKKHDALAEIIADESLDYLTDSDRAEMQDFLDKNKAVGHACLFETAKTYHYRPETICIDRIAAESGDSIHRFDELSKHGITSPHSWAANYPNSYTGANDYALNERIAKAIAQFFEGKLAETFRFLKNETISDEYHAEWLAKQHRLEY